MAPVLFYAHLGAISAGIWHGFLGNGKIRNVAYLFNNGWVAGRIKISDRMELTEFRVSGEKKVCKELKREGACS